MEYAAGASPSSTWTQTIEAIFGVRGDIWRRRISYRAHSITSSSHLQQLAFYRLEIGGEEEDTVKGFRNLTIVLLISVVSIFLALVFQFKNAIKPFIVFAAVPFGMVGALAALWIMGAPFGFMAFLGVVSLVGVIVSHIIVLFDFIEEKTPKVSR